METLPVIVLEKILSYMNAIDIHNAITSFPIDRNILGSIVHRKIILAYDYRCSQTILSTILRNIKLFVRELDLTGIHWLPSNCLIQNIKKIVNLEKLYLLGSSVILEKQEDLIRFENLQKLKVISICIFKVSQNELPKCYLFHRLTSDEFRIVMCFRMSQRFIEPSLMVAHENWLISLKKLKDSASANSAIAQAARDYKILRYDDLLGDQVDEFFKEITHTKILVLRKTALPRGVRQIDLKPITHLTNLTALQLDVVSAFGHSFMETIFQECPYINKLTIQCDTITFPLFQLKFAQHLEHLSIVMQTRNIFNMSKFFHDLSKLASLKLRRLYLRFLKSEDVPEGVHELRNYIAINPQLVFIFIMSAFTYKENVLVKKLLLMFHHHRYQYFDCAPLTFARGGISSLNRLPFVHWDMISDFYLNVIKPEDCML